MFVLNTLKAVILAAGQGTRMKSKVPKVLHKILGKTLLDYVIESAEEAGADEICVVVGHQSEIVMEETKKKVQFVRQEEQLGTGHAVMQARDFIGQEGQVLILFGDTPLIQSDTLKEMINAHNQHKNTVTVLSTQVDNPEGYGRIIRDTAGQFIKSVEHKDATDDERRTREINSGMYLYEAKALNEALKTLTTNNAQGEYYLPDTLTSLLTEGYKVDAMVTLNKEDVLGVNSRQQLAQASQIIQKRINAYWMLQGVTLINPSQTYISKEAIIEQDVLIYPNTFIEGESYIGEDSIIGPNTTIKNSKIGKGTTIEQAVVLQSEIGHHTNVGPFAYIRPNSIIGNEVKIGDFVEIKNAEIGDGTKASHLTYIGDAKVGQHVNFGCGTFVANYDGKKKSQTQVEDYAFIGCNTNLISPVKVGHHAYTAAGSTIYKDVPPYALSIARVEQSNKEDWVKRKTND